MLSLGVNFGFKARMNNVTQVRSYTREDGDVKSLGLRQQWAARGIKRQSARSGSAHCCCAGRPRATQILEVPPTPRV